MASFVSVIIPVFRQEARFRQCIQALERQTYPKKQYEVVVVNNDPSRALEIISTVMSLRVVEEAAIGSYAARNKGIAVSRGDVLAFTDDDCVPENDWLERGVAQLLKHPDAGLVAGKMVLEFRNGEPRNTIEWTDNLLAFDIEYYVKNLHFGVTGNLFTTRDIIQNVGCFNAKLKSGGDREWGQRVYAAGYTLLFGEDVRIHHPAIDSFRQYFKKVRRVAGGDADRDRLKGRSSIHILMVSSYQDIILVPIFLWLVATSPRVPNWIRKLQVMLMVVPWLGVRISERVHYCLGGSTPRA